MLSDSAVTTLAGWAGGLFVLAAAVGAIYLKGRIDGGRTESERWQERVVAAERAARQTEHDLAGIVAASAARISEKERLLHDQASRQSAAWRAALARVPDCRVPTAVGVQLDAAAGVPAAPAVAAASTSAPAALDAGPTCAEQLDAVRAAVVVCATNTGRLTEARDWYESVRARVNSGR